MSLTTGDIIDDKYRIIRLIGEGGMGAVYEGDNVRIHRKVAIKVLHSGVAENEDAVQRFEREAQAAGRIGSEHICEVLDLGNLPNGDRYMVMEFMDGEDLSSRIKSRERLTARETYVVAAQLLEGLRAAHAAGIIHRDLKPDNVFLVSSKKGQKDFVKILDFGISKFSALSGESGFSMTRTGAVMGTPYYMSPEQAKGAKGMDARADLYSAGVILYECVTGQVPFNADTFNELLFKIVLETPAPIEQFVPDIDPAFATLVTKAMAREPAHRYQTAQEFMDALEAWAATGRGASVPPEVAHAPGIRPELGPGVIPVQNDKSTPGAWANTGMGEGAGAALPRKRSPVLAVAIGAVILFGGVGIVAAVALAGGDRGSATAAEGSAAPTPAPSVASPEPPTPVADKPPEKPPDLQQSPDKVDKPAVDKPDPAAVSGAKVAPPRGAPREKPTLKPPPQPTSGKGGRTIRDDI